MVVNNEKEHSSTLHSIEIYNMRSLLFPVVSYIQSVCPMLWPWQTESFSPLSIWIRNMYRAEISHCLMEHHALGVQIHQHRCSCAFP